jgi:hypothetical protein
VVVSVGSVCSFRPAGYHFPPEVIAVAVRCYLRYGRLSYRDVEELLAERGVEVDHVTIYRWVQTFTAEFIDAARPTRRAAGDRWLVEETYVKVAGRSTYLYRAVDQHGQVIAVPPSTHRDAEAARRFFTRALRPGRCLSIHPPVDRQVIHLDTSLGQQLLDIAIGQAVTQVRAYRHRDHLTGKWVYAGLVVRRLVRG